MLVAFIECQGLRPSGSVAVLQCCSAAISLLWQTSQFCPSGRERQPTWQTVVIKHSKPKDFLSMKLILWGCIILQTCDRVGENARPRVTAVASSCECPNYRSYPPSSQDRLSLAGFFLSVVHTDFSLHVLLSLILKQHRHSHGQRWFKQRDQDTHFNPIPLYTAFSCKTVEIVSMCFSETQSLTPDPPTPRTSNSGVKKLRHKM